MPVQKYSITLGEVEDIGMEMYDYILRLNSYVVSGQILQRELCLTPCRYYLALGWLLGSGLVTLENQQLRIKK